MRISSVCENEHREHHSHTVLCLFSSKYDYGGTKLHVMVENDEGKVVNR